MQRRGVPLLAGWAPDRRPISAVVGLEWADFAHGRSWCSARRPTAPPFRACSWCKRWPRCCCVAAARPLRRPLLFGTPILVLGLGFPPGTQDFAESVGVWSAGCWRSSPRRSRRWAPAMLGTLLWVGLRYARRPAEMSGPLFPISPISPIRPISPLYLLPWMYRLRSLPLGPAPIHATISNCRPSSLPHGPNLPCRRLTERRHRRLLALHHRLALVPGRVAVARRPDRRRRSPSTWKTRSRPTGPRSLDLFYNDAPFSASKPGSPRTGRTTLRPPRPGPPAANLDGSRRRRPVRRPHRGSGHEQRLPVTRQGDLRAVSMRFSGDAPSAAASPCPAKACSPAKCATADSSPTLRHPRSCSAAKASTATSSPSPSPHTARCCRRCTRSTASPAFVREDLAHAAGGPGRRTPSPPWSATPSPLTCRAGDELAEIVLTASFGRKRRR